MSVSPFHFSRCAFWVSLLLVGLLSQPAATAQQRQPEPPFRGRSYTIEDTVVAVRRLFAAYDGRGTGLLAHSAGVLTAIGVATLLPAPFGAPVLKQTVVGGGMLLGGTGVVFGLGRMLRFRPKHRDEVLAAYLQGEPLPRYVRRRLRPEHFRAGAAQAGY